MNKKFDLFNHINPVTYLILLIIFFAITALPLTSVIQTIPSAYADQGVLGDSDEESEDEDEHEEEDENDEEDEHEEEDESKSSNEIEEKVQNTNGTTSTIQRKTEDNGNSKLKIKTYNYNGDLVEEKEYESEDEKAELQIKQFDNYGNKLLELKYRDENNNEIKLQVEGDSTGQSKVRYDFENQKMYINTENESDEENENEEEIEIEIDDNRFKIQHKNTHMHANFPIVVDEATGTIYVITGNGRVELKQLPDAVVENALKSENVDEVTDTSLDEDEDLKYLLEGNKKEKLFGLLNVNIQKTLIYDPETGELIDINLEPLQQILDYISF